MHLIKHSKNKSSSPGLYKKERAAILVMLFCFALSGVFLPNAKVKASLISSLDLPTIEATDAIQAELPEDISDEDTELDEGADAELSDEDSKEDDSEEEKEKDKEKENEKKDDKKKETSTETKADKNQTDKKPSGNASGGSSSGSGSSGNTSSGGSTSQAPAEKVWVPPVYETVHHEAVYQTVKVVVCNYCGAEFSSAGEFQVHKDANGG